MKTPDDNSADGPLAGAWHADGHQTPEQEFPTVCSRVIANPVHAQRLFRPPGVALARQRHARGLTDIGADTALPRSEP